MGGVVDTQLGGELSLHSDEMRLVFISAVLGDVSGLPLYGTQGRRCSGEAGSGKGRVAVGFGGCFSDPEGFLDCD